MLNNGIKKLSDDLLEEVTGGAGINYSDKNLKAAGVIIEGTGSNKKYYAEGTKGRQEITLNVAKNMYDCYCIGGNTPLNRSQVGDLITQSKGTPA